MRKHEVLEQPTGEVAVAGEPSPSAECREQKKGPGSRSLVEFGKKLSTMSL